MSDQAVAVPWYVIQFASGIVLFGIAAVTYILTTMSNRIKSLEEANENDRLRINQLIRVERSRVLDYKSRLIQTADTYESHYISMDPELATLLDDKKVSKYQEIVQQIINRRRTVLKGADELDARLESMDKDEAIKASAEYYILTWPGFHGHPS